LRAGAVFLKNEMTSAALPWDDEGLPGKDGPERVHEIRLSSSFRNIVTPTPRANGTQTSQLVRRAWDSGESGMTRRGAVGSNRVSSLAQLGKRHAKKSATRICVQLARPEWTIRKRERGRVADGDLERPSPRFAS
jgi:hypothetical protein